MIKRITIEKMYWFLIIVIIGIWGAVNMLRMESESLLTEETAGQKLILGGLFALTGLYYIINFKYIHADKIGICLGVLSTYMAIMRIVMLPNTANILSYFYQPMLSVIAFMLYLSVIAISNKAEELRTFFTSWIMVAVLILAYFYMQNWRYVNAVDEYHMGSAYWLLFLLPVLLYSDKKWLHYAGLVLVGGALFASFKRGGILAFGMGIIVFLLVKEFLLGHTFKKIIYFMVAIIALSIIFYFVDNA